MSNVIVKENETLDSALRRFKRNCAKAGIQQEIRKREHYEKPSVRRSLKLLENANIINYVQWIECLRTLYFNVMVYKKLGGTKANENTG